MSERIAKNFDDYASGFPPDVQRLLRTMRKTIQEIAPEATELISYKIPAFRLDRILVYYGAHTNHIGLYPGAAAIRMFEKELSAYKHAAGSVQFPLDDPLPIPLIAEIVAYCVSEQLARRKGKAR